MKKTIIILAILVLGVGFVLYTRQRNNTQEVESTNPENNTQAEQPAQALDPNLKYYTLSEVALHGGSNTYDDTQGYEAYSCWVALHNKVYDVSDYIESHPGGHIIEEGCGKDATELFETRPQGSGTPHSDKARAILEKYYIGELKK